MQSALVGMVPGSFMLVSAATVAGLQHRSGEVMYKKVAVSRRPRAALATGDALARLDSFVSLAWDLPPFCYSASAILVRLGQAAMYSHGRLMLSGNMVDAAAGRYGRAMGPAYLLVEMHPFVRCV